MEPDRSRERIITLAVVAGAALFVFLQLQPAMLFKHTTPTGSDLGGHIWEPNYLRGHLLPHGRLTGWAPDWHAGVPALVFYFPFPALVIALLSAVLPYTITFKLVLALSLTSVPVAAWAFGRLSGLRFPAPALMAVVAVPFLFDHFQPQTRGGDVISTLRGEYAFAIGLPLALLFLGLLARSLDTRRHQAAAAVLLGLVVLSHIFTTLFALAGAAVIALIRPSRRRFLDAAFVVAAGGLLAGFWLVPLRFRYGYAPPGLHDHVGKYFQNLFPFASRCAVRGQCQPGQFLTDETWHLGVVTLLAVVGVVISARRGLRIGLAIGALALAMAVGFVVVPGGRLQNDRFLPFWFLGLYLLAALGVAEGGNELQEWRARRRARGRGRGRARDASAGDVRPAVPTILPVAGLAFVVLLIGLPLRSVPGWLPVHTVDRGKVRLTMDFALGGYEGRPGWHEYDALMTTMDKSSELFVSTHKAIADAAGELLDRAKAAGVVREDVTVSDLLKLINGIGLCTERMGSAPSLPGPRSTRTTRNISSLMPKLIERAPRYGSIQVRQQPTLRGTASRNSVLSSKQLLIESRVQSDQLPTNSMASQNLTRLPWATA